MMVTVGVMAFARIGVSIHKTGLYKGTQGMLVALLFVVAVEGIMAPGANEGACGYIYLHLP